MYAALLHLLNCLHLGPFIFSFWSCNSLPHSAWVGQRRASRVGTWLLVNPPHILSSILWLLGEKSFAVAKSDFFSFFADVVLCMKYHGKYNKNCKSYPTPVCFLYLNLSKSIEEREEIIYLIAFGDLIFCYSAPVVGSVCCYFLYARTFC